MTVVMDWDLWCPKHLEPLREGWTESVVPQTIAMVGLFQEAASSPWIQAAADNDTEKLQEVMRMFKPICCFLPVGIAEAIIASALRREPYFNPEWPESMRIGAKNEEERSE